MPSVYLWPTWTWEILYTWKSHHHGEEMYAKRHVCFYLSSYHVEFTDYVTSIIDTHASTIPVFRHTPSSTLFLSTWSPPVPIPDDVMGGYNITPLIGGPVIPLSIRTAGAHLAKTQVMQSEGTMSHLYGRPVCHYQPSENWSPNI